MLRADQIKNQQSAIKNQIKHQVSNIGQHTSASKETDVCCPMFDI
jgi:hypothetical protein